LFPANGYSNKIINAEIEKIKTANVKNNGALKIKKLGLKELSRVHDYLFDLERQYRAESEMEQQRRRSWDSDIGL